MLNTPNILSLFRLCLVPVFVITYFSGLPYANVYAALIYALAAFTDFLDGYLARRFNLITNLGRVLDPLSDKMLTVSVLVCITIKNVIPLWAVAVVFVKELLMGLGGLLLHRRVKVNIPPSNLLGKVATTLFFVVCVLLMLWENINPTISLVLICVCVFMTLAAFVSYICRFAVIIKKRKID